MASQNTGFIGRSEVVLVITSIMIGLASMFTALRMLSKAWIVKRITIDDWVMVFAWSIAFGMSFAICYATAYGLGRHEVDVPDQWQGTLKKANYAFSVLYNPALMAQKTSILVFYLNLPASNKIFKWASIATLAVTNVGGLALTFLNAFQCSPPAAAYRWPDPGNASCVDIIAVYLSSAPLNIITDLAILFLPMPILTGMRLPKKQKIILVVTFGFGIFVTVVDVVRIAYLQKAAETRLEQVQTNTGGSRVHTDRDDFSWYASLSFMWSAIEVNIGIMCGCVPMLKPLVARIMPRMLKSEGESDTRFSSVSNDLGVGPPSIQDSVQNPSSAGPRKEEVEGPPSWVNDDGPMGMMDFLTTPETKEVAATSNDLRRSDTAQTNTTRNTAAAKDAKDNFFDFVDMNKKKSMVHMTNRECVFPIAMVTILFFVWGFSYGLLNVLNAQFQTIAHMSPGQSTAISCAYWLGYFFGPLSLGQWVLRHWGFKACYMVGLSIYACAALIFWPAAVLTSFPAYFITQFIAGVGLSTLEIAANPFMALCGPPAYAEIRLNLSQGIQAIGSIVAPLIADKAFVHSAKHAKSLVNTQWAYLGISLFTVMLAVVYYYVPLPEATDDELEEASERIDHANKAKLGNIKIIWITLGFAVWSQVCYVGGQQVIGTEYSDWLAAAAPDANSANYTAVNHTTFAVARFMAAGLGFFIKPRFMLMFLYLGAILFIALGMNFDGGTGIAMMAMVFFMEGPIFSLIFAQALRGMGRSTKFGAALITAAIGVGGACFPPIATAVAKSRGAQYSIVVAIATYAGGSLFPLYTNAIPQARLQVDPIKDLTNPSGSRPSSTSSKANRALNFLSGGKIHSKDQTAVEHKERTDSPL